MKRTMLVSLLQGDVSSGESIEVKSPEEIPSVTGVNKIDPVKYKNLS